MNCKFDKFSTFIKQSFEGVMKYFTGRLLAAFIIGLCVFAVMALLKAPLPWLFGILTGLGNLVPTIGPIAMYIVSAVILLFLQPIQALYLLAITIATQIIDGLILTPFITGKKTGIKPLIVIIIIMLGGSLFGIPGILLAVPAAIIVKIFYNVFLKSQKNE